MEIETSQRVVTKKVCNMIRIVLYMLREGIVKSKVMMELHLLLKRGKLAAGKAIANTLMLRHHYTCHRDNNKTTFISPRDYEFSCSNSPMFSIKRHKHNRHKCHQHDDVSTVSAVQKVLEMLNNNSDNEVEGSSPPLVVLPGFGKSPIGKQLRITDSPFPLKDEGDSEVDVAAEEFIKRFYENLNLQSKMASPYHNNNSWDR